MALKFYNSVAKKVKTKSPKVCRANSYFWRSYRRKTGSDGRELLAHPPELPPS